MNNSLVETYCTVKVCNNNEDCESQENYCTMRIRIPVTNGLFPYDESNGMTNDEVNELLPLDEGNSESNGLSDERRKRQMPNLLDYYKRKVTTPCPSDIIFFNRSSSDIPTLFVNIENRKRVCGYISTLYCTANIIPAYRSHCLTWLKSVVIILTCYKIMAQFQFLDLLLKQYQASNQ